MPWNFLNNWEKNMILHHLKLLIKQDIVKEVEDERYAAKIEAETPYFYSYLNR